MLSVIPSFFYTAYGNSVTRKLAQQAQKLTVQWLCASFEEKPNYNTSEKDNKRLDKSKNVVNGKWN